MLDSQREKSKSQFIMDLIAWSPEADPLTVRSKPVYAGRITNQKRKSRVQNPVPGVK